MKSKRTRISTHKPYGLRSLYITQSHHNYNHDKSLLIKEEEEEEVTKK